MLAGCAGRHSVPPAPRVNPRWQILIAIEPPIPRSLDPVTFRVQVHDARGRPVSGARVTVSLTMPSMTMGRNDVPARPQGSGLYAGSGRFTMPGEWLATVTAVRGRSGDTRSVSVRVR